MKTPHMLQPLSAVRAEHLSLSLREPGGCRAALLRAARHAHKHRIQNRNTPRSMRE